MYLRCGRWTYYEKTFLAVSAGELLFGCNASNYVIGEDVESDEEIKAKLKRAEHEIETISAEILQKKRVYRVSEGSLKALKTNFINPAFNKFARSTKPFYADKSCTGCGLCERTCPAGTIKLVNSSPTWERSVFSASGA